MVGGIRVGYTWPYYRLFDAIKLGTGRVQGYGLAQLLNDIRRARAGSAHLSEVARVAGIEGREVRKRALRSIERLLSVQLGDWNSRDSADLFKKYPTDLAEVAIAISARLRGTNKSVLSNVKGMLTAMYQGNVTNGFAVWRLYEPLKELISQRLPACKMVAVRSCYAERAGEEVREDSGEIRLLATAESLINWQTAHGSHTKDKKKELSGRAVGLRYMWLNGRYIIRPNVRRLLLVLDGTWQGVDLQALLRAGWDDIYYPDEMDRLAKAIV